MCPLDICLPCQGHESGLWTQTDGSVNASIYTCRVTLGHGLLMGRMGLKAAPAPLAVRRAQETARAERLEQDKSNNHRAPGWISRLSNQLLISVQVMISGFVGSSPTSGSLLTVCLGFSLSLSLSAPPVLKFSVSQNK